MDGITVMANLVRASSKIMLIAIFFSLLISYVSQIQVVLDDNEFSEVSTRAKHLLHGSGSSIWFDKSFCAIFFKDGKMGVNCEHSWADAPVMGHMMEYALTTE